MIKIDEKKCTDCGICYEIKLGTGELYLNQKITLKNFFGARLAMF